ncbi:hypothetical protein DFQ05_0026 [Winogradskyella wandonensis]|uniref:Methyltransferase family protein n=1 Tax=Winogradskyella wandonensis TaxID=1442586 RepID=A0A4R1KTL7_9FLAO|nr:hypothetical protein [Winogradskyella wandonensis]TCK68518.1 hypothetical protein DFQ05_0026 [Winogradskyella wandonensis]
MFENYPKKRPPLSEKIQDIYDEQYKSNRDGITPASGLAQKMERWLHQKVCSDVGRVHNKKTLEIGAGTLNQLQYEESNHYDIIEPFKKLYYKSRYLEKIKNIYNDIDEIGLSNKYDRITSIATFEHITDLPKVVAKSCLLLKPKGSLRTSIPNEGTFLWTLGWKLTTGIEFRLKHGLDYGNLMRHEHVNNAREIDEILNYFYENNTCSVFGLSKGIGFYRFYESKNPNRDRAENYLKTLQE